MNFGYKFDFSGIAKDSKLEINGETYEFSRTAFQLQSSFSISDQVKFEINISRKSIQEFVAAINMNHIDIDDDNVIGISILAEKFGFIQLFDICKHFIDQSPNKENLMLQCLVYKCDSSLSTREEEIFMSNSIKRFVELKPFINLDVSTLLRIIAQANLETEDRKRIIHQIITSREDKESAFPLFSLLNLNDFSYEEKCELVKESKEHPTISTFLEMPSIESIVKVERSSIEHYQMYHNELIKRQDMENSLTSTIDQLMEDNSKLLHENGELRSNLERLQSENNHLKSDYFQIVHEKEELEKRIQFLNANGEILHLGDEVRVIGPYASSCSDKNLGNSKAFEQIIYVLEIRASANNPYRCGFGNATTGWFPRKSLQKC